MVAGNAEDKVSNVQAIRAAVCKKERCKKVWEIIYGAIKAPHFEVKRRCKKVEEHSLSARTKIWKEIFFSNLR